MLSSADFLQFNALKHHAGRIREIIAQTVSKAGIIKQLQKIGQSQMDLYTGKLSVEQLEQETMKYLESKKAFYHDDFLQFLGAEGYRMFAASDGSEWVLRYGYDDPLHYVHLHPARYAENTIRVKSGALKTAIALCWYQLHEGTELPAGTELVNRLRAELADLSPVADAAEMSHAAGIMQLLRQ
ncbi:MAG: hypothetical protein FD123_3405 [Bacteroidetes bacterium]|nr:MAG: hypothetical protein FD123_3405 [Bacteroidota bacterium]